MYISARADYAARALVVLAASPGAAPMRAEAVAAEQGLPPRFVENLLVDLRRGNLVESQRGRDGGYRLARPADAITVGDVIRVVEGPLAEVRGLRPEEMRYEGAAEHLQHVWVATRAALRQVLDATTIDQVARGKLPRPVRRLLEDPGAWLSR